MALKSKGNQPQTPEPLLHVYYPDESWRPKREKVIALGDLNQSVINGLISPDRKPLLIVNYLDKPGCPWSELTPVLGRSLVVCSATRFILLDRAKLDIPELRNMVNIAGGRFYIESNTKESVYAEFAHLLNLETSETMAPALYRMKLCEGVRKLATAMEPEYRNTMPDFSNLRVSNAFTQNNVRTLRDLSNKLPHQILRMRNFGMKSLLAVFVGLMKLAKPTILQDEAACSIASNENHREKRTA